LLSMIPTANVKSENLGRRSKVNEDDGVGALWAGYEFQNWVRSWFTGGLSVILGNSGAIIEERSEMTIEFAVKGLYVLILSREIEFESTLGTGRSGGEVVFPAN